MHVRLTVPGPPHSPEMVAQIRRAQDEGGMHGLGLNVDDCQKTYEELASRGVEFLQKPEKRPYGTEGAVSGQLRELAGPGRAVAVLSRPRFQLLKQM